jgi:hypothetical protein
MNHAVYIVVLMSDWHAVSENADLKIPRDAVDRIAPILDALHASFRPLLSKIPFTIDPAVVLSEKAVKGE